MMNNRNVREEVANYDAEISMLAENAL
jgi:hypothetical protein